MPFTPSGYPALIDVVLSQVLDIRSPSSPLPSLTGHTDTPTSLSISPNGNFLLSPSLSSQTIIHDIRPFSPSPSRIHRVLVGAPAGFENTLLRGAWSKDDGGKRVGVGGADRTVCIWDVESGQVQYKVCTSGLHSPNNSNYYPSFSCPDTRVQLLLSISTRRNPSVSLFTPPHHKESDRRSL